MEDILQALPIQIPRRSETILQFKERGGSIAAVLPIHAPRALLRAFGILPVEVWGPPLPRRPAPASSRTSSPAPISPHLQSYVCSVARCALDFILSGGLVGVDFILVPHACDSLQGLGSLLIDFVRPAQPVFPFYLPRGRRESDLRFLAQELRLLYRRLEAASSRSPAEAELWEAIRREEAADELLARLHKRRRELPLDGMELYRLIRSREYLPAETFGELAQSILDRAEPGRQQSKAIILLSGIVPEPLSLFNAIEDAGGWVAADDLAACGRRLYPPGRNQDPFVHLAESLQGAPPDPTHGSPIAGRLAHLLKLAAETGARRVLFYEVKFCEPELFDLPLLRGGLQEAGLRSLALEVDLGEDLSQQALTRLGAFMEMPV